MSETGILGPVYAGDCGDAPPPRRRRFWFATIRGPLAGTFCPPLTGVSGTVFGMVKAFETRNSGAWGRLDHPVRERLFHLLTAAGGLVATLLSAMILVASPIRFPMLPKQPLSDSGV